MKYTIWIKTTLITIVSVFSLATAALPAQPSANISAQLQIILNDEACVQVINQIKKLHDALEQILSTEFKNNNTILETKLRAHIKKVCGLGGALQIVVAKEPLIKLLIAFCDASSAFIEEIMERSQAQHEVLKSFKEKALTVCQKIKAMFMGSSSPANPSGFGVNMASIDKCYTLIAGELSMLIHQPNVVINNIPITLQEIDSHIHPYTLQFSTLLKKAIAQNLSDKDLTTLITFFEGATYLKLKNNLPQITELVLQSFSPAVKTKAKGLLDESWNKTRGSVVSLLQKLKS